MYLISFCFHKLFKNLEDTDRGFQAPGIMCLCTHVRIVCVSGWRRSASLSRNPYNNSRLPETLKLQLLKSYPDRKMNLSLPVSPRTKASFLFLTLTFLECKKYSLPSQKVKDTTIGIPFYS